MKLQDSRATCGDCVEVSSEAVDRMVNIVSLPQTSRTKLFCNISVSSHFSTWKEKFVLPLMDADCS